MKYTYLLLFSSFLAVFAATDTLTASKTEAPPSWSWPASDFHKLYYGEKNYNKSIQKNNSLSTILRAEKHKANKDYSAATLLYNKALQENIDSSFIRFKLVELQWLQSPSTYLKEHSLRNNLSSFWKNQADKAYWDIMLQDTSLASSAYIKFYNKHHSKWPKEQKKTILKDLAKKNGAKLPINILWPIFKGNIGTLWQDSAYHWISSNSQKKMPDSILVQTILYLKQKQKPKKALALIQKLKRTSSLKNFAKTKADLLFSAKQFSEARKAYKAILKKPGKSKAWAHLQVARSYRAQKNKTQSSKWYRSFRKKFPKHNKTAEMHWTNGFSQEQAKNYTAATTHYRKINSKFGNHKRRKWVDFRIAYLKYKQGKCKQAQPLLDKAVAHKKWIWSRNGAMLLKGHCYQKQGNDSLAVLWYKNTIKDFPLSFYAFQARKALSEKKLLPDSLIPKLSPLLLSPEQTKEWLRKTSHSKHLKDNWSLKSKDQIELLLAIGDWGRARSLYLSEQRKHSSQLDFLYEYAALFLEYGDLARSYRNSRKLINRLPRQSLDKAPKALLHILYPTPYPTEIQNGIAGSPLDPYFVTALMRQESIFDDAIESPAGAIGLMQIMPYTGKALATQENLSSFHPEQLRNPLLAIKLGTRYLKDLWKQWQDPRWVLGNYNAGPAPTKRWKKNAINKEYIIQVEDVSYWETRDYIKKVMGNYWVYQSLYSKP